MAINVNLPFKTILGSFPEDFSQSKVSQNDSFPERQFPKNSVSQKTVPEGQFSEGSFPEDQFPRRSVSQKDIFLEDNFP